MSNDNYESRLKNALINEHSKIFDNINKTLKDSVRIDLKRCPVCETTQSKIYCIKDLFVHKQCKKCGFVYLDPRLNQSATVAFYNSEVNEIYNESKFHSTTEPDDVENLKNYELLRKHIEDPRGKRLLEIGCGKGTFLTKAANDGFEVHGIELNQVLLNKLRKITNHIYEDDILSLDLPNDYFDVIYFRDVMEHIPSIQDFLRKVTKVLKPGGIVFIDTHNINSIVNVATKEYHTVIFAFEHPVHWSPGTLTLAGKIAGLKSFKTYFDHSHQSIGRIVDYYLNPSFTYIFPPKINGLKLFFLKLLNRLLKNKYLGHLDIVIMRSISKATNSGSKMQLLLTK